MPGFLDKLKAKISNKKDKQQKEIMSQENTAAKAAGKDTRPAEGEVHILPVPGVRI